MMWKTILCVCGEQSTKLGRYEKSYRLFSNSSDNFDKLFNTIGPVPVASHDFYFGHAGNDSTGTSLAET